MNFYNYDLHTHSCLSPCGDREMTPNNLINMALVTECEIIALSDHNSCKNLPATMKIGEEAGLLVVPAIELCTSEEAHILCIFEDLKGAMDFDKFVYPHIPMIKNKPEIFGEQLILDEYDNVIGSEEKLLITATDINSWELCDLLKNFGGVAIPAHIDKSSYSLLASLGDFPSDYGFKAIEIKEKEKTKYLLDKYKCLNNLKIIHNSDTHYLENFLDEYNKIGLENLSLKAVVDYFR